GNSYYYDGSAPEEGGPDGVAIARVFQLHLSQVLAEDGTGLSEWQREQVCEGNAAWWIKTDAQLPAIDLSSLGVLAQLIDEGVVVPSGEWTGDGGWNQNVDGLIWSPKVVQRVDRLR
ncbi:hypothetical protein JS562_55370, partial [Agrobacterium sp. S2]|nr:hypothetical protein [Agrobacterium sp. S2]